jgi:hypothetical protein
VRGKRHRLHLRPARQRRSEKLDCPQINSKLDKTTRFKLRLLWIARGYNGDNLQDKKTEFLFARDGYEMKRSGTACVIRARLASKGGCGIEYTLGPVRRPIDALG